MGPIGLVRLCIPRAKRLGVQCLQLINSLFMCLFAMDSLLLSVGPDLSVWVCFVGVSVWVLCDWFVC